MFTGIVQALGRIAAADAVGGDRRLSLVTAGPALDGISLGDSIAVNGVCLTVVTLLPQGFVADVSVETLEATTARGWQPGRVVNLERALTPTTPLGGHLMSGHVDGVGHLVEQHEDARSRRLRFEAPAELARYVARKGSIAIDGVSLTVNAVDATFFEVNIVPHTWTHTTLGTLTVGDAVNLEVDLIARYLERLIEGRK